jgi:hypothetical protein
MRCSAVISVALLASVAGMAQELEPHTIKSNLQYRLADGDLPKLSFGRENTSPSMHAIFRQVPDEPLQAWVDPGGLASPISQSRLAHLREFLYEKVTLQDNAQERMLANLQRSLSDPLATPADPEIPLTVRDRLTLFSDKTLTQVQPYAASIVSSAFLELFSPSRVWGQGADLFTNHLVASFARRLVTYGIQSGVAAALHEDVRYRPSNSRNAWKRSAHAIASTLVLQTPRGSDIAFANIVAAFGSAEVINLSNPGREGPDHQATWGLAAENLLGFAEANLWNEFKPDLKRLLRSRLLPRGELKRRHPENGQLPAE